MLFSTAYQRSSVCNYTVYLWDDETGFSNSLPPFLPPSIPPSPLFLSLSLFGVTIYIEPRDSSMSGKHYTTELHPQSRFKISQVMEVILLKVKYMGMSFRFEDETCLSLLTHCFTSIHPIPHT